VKASVIIPTWNGAKKLPDTMEALCNQSFHDFETIIVVDGSTDTTADVLRGYQTRLRSLKVHIQDNKGRAGARNAGARLASADLLIFIDDDIEVGPDNIQRHLLFHQEKKGDLLVGKAILDKRRIKEDPFLLYRFAQEMLWNNKHAEGLNRITFQDYVFSTQNMSLSRSDFVSAGGFDERLSDSEDFDLSIRLLSKGLRMYYDTTLEVLHHDYCGIEGTVRRQVEYYRSKQQLLQLHPEYMELVPKQFLWSRKTYKDQLRYLLFTRIGGWEYFFNGRFFSLLPKSLQHALFSTFIYSRSVLKVKGIR
jgi:glycosyltransferase involved in cell wall biosynthesis